MSDPFDTRVVVFARPDDPADLRAVLQETLGLNSVDAGIAARRVPGLLSQRFTAGQARAVAARISTLGLRSAAVPESEIPPIQHAETVHHLRCVDEGLEIVSLQGEADRRWPWGHLRLISVGRVPLEQTRRWIVGQALHVAPIPAAEGVETGVIEGLEAWLVFENPLRVLRFENDRMNYEYLGGAMTSSGSSNFDLLLADLVRRAPQAFVPRSTREYLARGPLQQYDYASSEDLQRETITEYLLLKQMQSQAD